MTLPLTSTCVGGRRASEAVPPVLFAPKKRSDTPAITKREREVLEAVIDTGLCTHAAIRLGISIKTVETHMLHLREKFFAISNYQLIAAYVTAQLKGNQ